jgi:hypothetical protein
MHKIIFSDETKVVISQNNSVSVHRKASEKKPHCLKHTVAQIELFCLY